jgi:hypothetical protein
MNIGVFSIWGILFYVVIAFLAIIFAYLGILALQAIIRIDNTLKDMLALSIDREKKKEEREMRRI